MRRLSSIFIADLRQGRLSAVLDLVKEDATLSLAIRNEYVNIYYRGGNIMKISRQKNRYLVDFDSRYCSNHVSLVKSLPKDDIPKWVNAIPHIKQDMNKYFQSRPKPEREYQQLVVRENNTGRVAKDTDYFIVDVEYIPSGTRQRFDMIAVKWLSNNIHRRSGTNTRLAFIEKKYGDRALVGPSGLVSHVQSVYRFLARPQVASSIHEEAESLFNQQYELSLIEGVSKGITLPCLKPELLLLIANHKPDSHVLDREVDRLLALPEFPSMMATMDIRFIRASYMGFGLYDRSMIDL